jgi:hypothetical protein
MWMIRRIALAAAIVGLAPIALAGLAFALPWAFACPITEGGPHPCPVLGADIGGFMQGLLILTVPAAILPTLPALAVVVVWAVTELIAFTRNA